MLREISQRKTNTIRFHLYVEYKKQTHNKQKPRCRESIDDCQMEVGEVMEVRGWRKR